MNNNGQNQKMKITCFVVLLTLAFSPAIIAQTLSGYIDMPGRSETDTPTKTNRFEYPGVVVQGWQLALRFPTNTFQMGTNVEAQIVVRNLSTNQLNLSVAWPLLANGFNVQVLGKQNAKVPLTPKGLSQHSSGSASPNVTRRFAPNTEMALRLSLTELFQLASPGIYTVQATRSLPSSGDTAEFPLATGPAQITIAAPTPGAPK